MSFGNASFAEYPSSSFSATQVNIEGFADLSVTREFRIFSATSEFVTLPTDTLATQPFFGTLVQPLSFTRSLLGSDIIGNFTSGTGELDLANTDGGYDFLIQRFAIDGRSIVVKVGAEGDPYDKFYTIFSGVASDWSVQEDVVKISLVDNSYLLSVTVQPNLYGGTGGIDGTADLAGKRKPRCFGSVLNISPPLVIPTSLVYQVNDGSISGVSNVLDRGVALTFSADYPTVSALIAATIPAGNWASCNAFGFFRLNSTPTGTITAHVYGDNTGGVYVSRSADIVKRIIATTASISEVNDLYLPSFDLVNAAQPADIGYWIAPDDTNTIADVLSNIMGGIGGWAGFKRSGKLEVGIFLSPTEATPNSFFDRVDIREMKREALPSALSPPPYRFRCSYQHNWTVQTDLAGAATAATRSFGAQEDRYSNSTNLSVLLDHPFAHDRDPVKSYFVNQTDAQTESDRLLALYRGSTALYRFKVGVQPYALDLGDVINVTYPRWDLTVGRSLRIVEMTEDAQNETIEVVGYG